MIKEITGRGLAILFGAFVLAFPFLVMALIIFLQRLIAPALGFEMWPWNVVSGGVVGWLVYLFIGMGAIGDGA